MTRLLLFDTPNMNSLEDKFYIIINHYYCKEPEMSINIDFLKVKVCAVSRVNKNLRVLDIDKKGIDPNVGNKTINKITKNGIVLIGKRQYEAMSSLERTSKNVTMIISRKRASIETDAKGEEHIVFHDDVRPKEERRVVVRLENEDGLTLVGTNFQAMFESERLLIERFKKEEPLYVLGGIGIYHTIAPFVDEYVFLEFDVDDEDTYEDPYDIGELTKTSIKRGRRFPEYSVLRYEHKIDPIK